MTLVYVRNTFIEIAQDESSIESYRVSAPSGADKRSSSAPPGCVAVFEAGEERQEKPQQSFSSKSLKSKKEKKAWADYTVDDVCFTPCFLSPRSECESTSAASSEHEKGTALQQCSSDGDSCTDATNHAALDTPASWDPACSLGESPRSTRNPRVAAHLEQANPDDVISSEELQDFSVCIKKANDLPLGMDVDRSDGITLFIRSISRGGLVEAWNQANPDTPLLEGDRIVKVNSTSGSALELLRECKRRPVLQMRVLRNARPELLAALVAAFCAASNTLSSKASTPAPAAAPVAAAAPRGRKQVRTQVTIPDTVSVGAANQRKVLAQPPAVHMQMPVQSALCSSSQAFNPSFGAFGSGAFAGNTGLICSEVSAVLHSVTQALAFSQQVNGVQVCEGAMGSSSAINIDVAPSVAVGDMQGLCALAKSALLDAASQSQNTYIVGYLETPFVGVNDLCFSCTVAKVPNSDKACWDFYQRGFCPRPATCRWCHPEGTDLMTLWVSFKL